MKFEFLTSQNIDKARWDNSIANSMFPISYAFTWYLNALSDQWAAIVNNDYSIVMPLLYSTKFSRFHFYQSPLVPKLGYFYKNLPTQSDIEKLNKVLLEKATSIDVIFNKFNTINGLPQTKNYFLSIDLFNQYTKIRQNYSAYLKKLLSSNTDKYYIITGISPNEIISFLHKVNYYKNNKNFTDLRRILSIASLKRMANVLAVFSETNELIGVGIFVLSSYTVDLLVIAAIDDNEKILSLIIDKFININAGKTFTLNFECKNSVNAQKIYAEFGAEKYFSPRIIFKKKTKFFKIFQKNQ